MPESGVVLHAASRIGPVFSVHGHLRVGNLDAGADGVTSAAVAPGDEDAVVVVAAVADPKTIFVLRRSCEGEAVDFVRVLEL
jgi:hypothetical protein